MEDLITIIIAALVGLFSLLGSRKKKTPAPSAPSPDEIVVTDEYGKPVAYESGTPPQVRPRPASSKEESPFDVLGRVLRGDFSDFEAETKRPKIPVDVEFSDPVAARRKPAKTKKASAPEPIAVRRPAPKRNASRPAFNDREALRNAVLMQEILGPPKARRRSRPL